MRARNWFFTMVVSCFAAYGWSEPSAAPSLGLAESRTEYQIARDEKTVLAPGDTLTNVLTGDRLSASEKPVRVQTSSGDTVLIQSKGSAEFVRPDLLNVVSGDVLVAIGKESQTHVSIDDLLLEPVAGEGKDQAQHLVAINRLGESHVKISGYNHPVAVRTAGASLAILGSKDTIELVKKPKQGWTVVAAEGEEEPAEEEPMDEEPEEDEEDRGAMGWFLTPLGLIVTGGLLIGAAFVASETLGGDDGGGGDGDDGRPPTSRFFGGGPSEFQKDSEEKEEEVSAFSFSFSPF